MENFLGKIIESKGIGIGLSFIGGILTFFSPCLLPLIPIYFTFLAEKSIERIKHARQFLFLETICFVLGFTFIFVILGASATTIGGFVFKNLKIFRILGGVFIIFLAVNFMELVRFNFLQKGFRVKVRSKVPFLGSFLFGIVFGISWTPCAGAVLGTILTFAAFQGTLKKGIILLVFYSLGVGLPFLLFSLFLSGIKKWQIFLNKHYKKVQYATGVILLLFGYFLLY